MCKWQVSALLRLTSKIGSFRRVGCSAVRGTKTALAVLAMLASVLAWGSAPVRADDNDGDLGRDKVRVLTQNMYIGADLTPIALAKTFPQFRDAITTVTEHCSHQARRTGGCHGGRNCKTAPGFCGAARGMEAERGGHRPDGPAERS